MLAMLAILAMPALAQPAHREQLAAKLRNDLQRLATAASGVVGISVVDLSSGQRFDFNESLVFPQGSDQDPDPDRALSPCRSRRGEAERSAAGSAEQPGRGSGLLQHFSDGGSELSLHDLAVAMIVLSDNSATNVLIDRLGMERVSQTMAEMGAGQTKLQRKMIRPEESAKGNENLSTPKEAADLMARIARCDLPVSPASCAASGRSWKSQVRRVPRPIPAPVAVAWKPGGIEGAQTRGAWSTCRVRPMRSRS